MWRATPPSGIRPRAPRATQPRARAARTKATPRKGEPMRKIAAGLFISLDGVVESPEQWHFPYFNDEMGASVDATLGAADTLLLGRKTYDSFAGAWPGREAEGG